MMTDENIKNVVSPLLHERFRQAGFRHATVKSEEDFDGSSVLRVTAHLSTPNVSSDDLIAALHQIRTELLSRGEERFVFLNSKSPHDETIEEDVE
jgi:hypothetical protein